IETAPRSSCVTTRQVLKEFLRFITCLGFTNANSVQQASQEKDRECLRTKKQLQVCHRVGTIPHRLDVEQSLGARVRGLSFALLSVQSRECGYAPTVPSQTFGSLHDVGGDKAQSANALR